MIDLRSAASPVFLLGMPRSGTTWLSQIFESSPDFLVRLSPNFSYLLKNQLDDASTRDEWIDQLAAAASSDDPFMTQNWRRDTGELGIFDERSTGCETRLAVKDTRFHHLYQQAMELLPGARCIYVVRHPAGAINSWWRSKEFPPEADLAREWRSGTCRKNGPGEYWGFDDWRALTEQYLDLEARQPLRYRTFRYEDLVDDPHRQTAELFSFVGCATAEPTTSFIAESQSRHDDRPYAVYKDPSVAERWRDQLPIDIISRIEAELRATRLERFLE